MKSLMNRYVKLLSFLPGICLIVACTGHQIKGYEINGSAPLPEFEGKNGLYERCFERAAGR